MTLNAAGESGLMEVEAKEGVEAAVRNIKLLKGTVIACPKCRKHLLTVKRDIYPDDPIRSADFEGIGNYRIVQGRSRRCPIDGKPYFRNNPKKPTQVQVRTTKGWR